MPMKSCNCSNNSDLVRIGTPTSISFLAVAHMPATATDNQESTGKAYVDSPMTLDDGEKAKRPKNAFVIYRLQYTDPVEEIRTTDPYTEQDCQETV